jgi:hypothetical protein
MKRYMQHDVVMPERLTNRLAGGEIPHLCVVIMTGGDHTCAIVRDRDRVPASRSPQLTLKRTGEDRAQNEAVTSALPDFGGAVFTR